MSALQGGLKGLKREAARADVPTNEKTQMIKTYNSQDSHVVTHHTTNWPACGLSTAERTGSPVLHTLWSYVLITSRKQNICPNTPNYNA
ncbi:uncharacterized protein N7458_002929 [Penicillium daleae]|uniref:Uncharacterized protein n=1 Tax=Penicillium daleae TaxID=63821 RepID=A0AAD6G7N7_9EURO|nr:uncharacterized protein N7458_002929 [Penicillium daleae]KAJ5461377.1 hypothetical protein N7458_002929 [Penicillium daleae]